MKLPNELGQRIVVVEIAHRHPEGFGASRLGVLGMQQDGHVVFVTLDVAADSQGGNAAASDRPQAQERKEKAIAILDLAVPAPAVRYGDSLVHELDPVVKGVTGEPDARSGQAAVPSSAGGL